MSWHSQATPVARNTSRFCKSRNSARKSWLHNSKWRLLGPTVPSRFTTFKPIRIPTIPKRCAISQSYLESVCTETSADETSEFQRELRQVIFSHIGDEEKLGKDSLDELIAYKTEEIGSESTRLKSELSQANAVTAALEQKAAP